MSEHTKIQSAKILPRLHKCFRQLIPIGHVALDEEDLRAQSFRHGLRFRLVEVEDRHIPAQFNKSLRDREAHA